MKASPENVAECTAVGWFFADFLQRNMDVPVGIINASYGGSNIEAWMNAEACKQFDDIPVPPLSDETSPWISNVPTVLYNGMIHPLVGYGIKGIIWYQGESNIFNVPRYAPSVAAMVSKWREAWGLGEVPFYYAQIAPYDYKEWNFFNAFCLTTEYPERPIRFFFEFRESSGGNIFDLINNKQKCICRDGLIKEVTVGNFEECAFVNNREEAVEILGNIAKIFEEYLNNEGLAAVDDYHQCFSISFRRHGIPSHLFEKSEIETAMRNADDRHNNQLVVDEDGYDKIISDNKDGMLYPVRLECWNAGNNYVGKFSKLCTLDEDYKYCLHGWLRYLKTGRKQYMDYLTEEIEEDSLISQIKEFYNK